MKGPTTPRGLAPPLAVCAAPRRPIPGPDAVGRGPPHCCYAAALMAHVAGAETPTNATRHARAGRHPVLLATGPHCALALPNVSVHLQRCHRHPLHWGSVRALCIRRQRLPPSRRAGEIAHKPPRPRRPELGWAIRPLQPHVLSSPGNVSPSAAATTPSLPGLRSRGVPIAPQRGTHPAEEGSGTAQWALPAVVGLPLLAAILAVPRDVAPRLAHPAQGVSPAICGTGTRGAPGP